MLRCFIFLMVLVIGFPAFAGEKKDVANMSVKEFWVAAEFPGFADYPVKDGGKQSEAANIDLSSHPHSKKCEDVLRKGYTKPADYAGHYVVIETPCEGVCNDPAKEINGVLTVFSDASLAPACRTDKCRAYWIVDKRDGKIKTIATADHDVGYVIDSTLFIVNPYNEFLDKKYADLPEIIDLAFYNFKDGDLDLITSTCCGPETTK